MHNLQMIELGAFVVAHGHKVIFGDASITKSDVERYWSASKCRLDRWSQALKQTSEQLQADNPTRRAAGWQRVRPVLEEILTGELLSRTWTAIGVGYDYLRGASEVEPVLRSVLIGHLEARNRALNLMVYGRSFALEDAVQLNQLRRKIERWTDLLLGYMVDQFDIDDLTFDAVRARDFMEDVLHERRRLADERLWQILMSSMQTFLGQGLCERSENEDLNADIANSVMSCFGRTCYDSLGLPTSGWMQRIQKATSDTQGMIDELISDEDDARFELRFDATHPADRWKPRVQ